MRDSRQKGEENREHLVIMPDPPTVETTHWLYVACFKRREAVVEGLYSQMILDGRPAMPESL